MMMICKRYFTQCWPPTFTEALSFVAGAGVKPTYEWRTEIFGDSIETRPSALGKSDPFCGPSNPQYLFTKDYTIFCGPSNPQYLFPKDCAIFL